MAVVGLLACVASVRVCSARVGGSGTWN